MNKDSKIYIAGHRGLVGSAIWKNLLQRGYTNLIGRTHAELDLLDSVKVKDFFQQEKPEYVVLAAAHVGGIAANNKYRADFIWKNLQIQQNVIRESYYNGVKKLLFLGSTCIYPCNAPQPIKEEYLLTSPLEYTNEPYAIAKIAGLKMCESFNIQYGTNFIAVMPTNLYGPNDNFNLETSHVLPAMIRKMHLAKLLSNGDWNEIAADLNTRPIENIDGNSDKPLMEYILNKYGIFKTHLELWGNGTPLREFLWSEDMADATVHILENINFNDLSKDMKQIRNCHINIGTGKELTIRQLAEKIQNNINYNGDICWNSSQPNGTPRKLCDVNKLHSLGWHHKIEIDEGIAMLYRWYCDSIS